MISPSDASILRVYLPSDLVDQLHALSRATGLPMRKVVRGVLELGLGPYLRRWHDNAQPTYDDELSDRPYQEGGSVAPERPGDRERFGYQQTELPGLPPRLDDW